MTDLSYKGMAQMVHLLNEIPIIQNKHTKLSSLSMFDPLARRAAFDNNEHK